MTYAVAVIALAVSLVALFASFHSRPSSGEEGASDRPLDDQDPDPSNAEYEEGLRELLSSPVCLTDEELAEHMAEEGPRGPAFLAKAGYHEAAVLCAVLVAVRHAQGDTRPPWKSPPRN